MSAFSLRTWSAWPRCLSLLLIWGCLLAGTRAAAQSWQKAVVASATGSYHVTATAADAAGNVYIAGVVVSSATFGTTTLTNPNTPPGGGNVFIAKWSSSTNTFVWAYLVSGSGGSATALALNGPNVYLAGSISTFNFGGLPFSSGNGGFVARLTDAGASASFVWVRRAGTTGVKAMAVQGTSVFVTGGFFGTEVFGSTTLVSMGVGNDEDIFVAKLVDTGPGTNFVWVQQGGSISMDAAHALAVEGANVYVAGNFSGATATFGSTTLTNPNVPSVPVRTRLFIAKLTDAGTSGSFGWAQQAGGSLDEKVNAMAVTGGSVYLVGYFEGPLGFTFGSVTLSAATNLDVDIFMAKLTDAGTSSSFGWAQRIGGSGYDAATGLVSTAAGVYVSGFFLSPTISFGATTLTRTGSADIFVAKLLDAGATSSFDWVQQAVGGNSTAGNAGTQLAVVGKAVYVAGDLAPPVMFGSQTITGSSSSLIGFWAQLQDNSLVLAAAAPQPWAGAEVYPNPAHTSTHVQLPAVSGPTQATLTLRDALGRAVRCQQLSLPATNGAEVPLQGLVPGLYHLQLQAGDWRSSHPLVVE